MSTALVTGGSRGIGSVIAKTLARSGYDVAICYAGNEEAAAETVKECETFGIRALAFKADVSSEADVNELFSKVKEALGPVEVLVNNAGITKDGLLIRMSEADFDAVYETNLKGTFLCCKAAIKDMMKARYGKIINITSDNDNYPIEFIKKYLSDNKYKMDLQSRSQKSTEQKVYV